MSAAARDFETLPFSEEVFALVSMIPTGCVLSYGDVAGLLGSRAARAVGRVMRDSGSELPWWRVVSARGDLPAALAAQARRHYSREQTPMRANGTVDLAAARWHSASTFGIGLAAESE
ncbi:MGMT family protein [Pseudoclavibacter sp. 13-3]|uniref:MGMT family protein n=1 Tax=Pseudoclavibacter sp. 13-3 TaxID=2901228 RepID=UPI001E56EE61|nr:MGMT family protein [Pseudoclavibacter sp. 13-3]MCD7101925.1 MGMT family protein [Pseudoclavibacter sp. 13-3]